MNGLIGSSSALQSKPPRNVPGKLTRLMKRTRARNVDSVMWSSANQEFSKPTFVQSYVQSLLNHLMKLEVTFWKRLPEN